jgi:hypothetical protein
MGSNDLIMFCIIDDFTGVILQEEEEQRGTYKFDAPVRIGSMDYRVVRLRHDSTHFTTVFVCETYG